MIRKMKSWSSITGIGIGRRIRQKEGHLVIEDEGLTRERQLKRLILIGQFCPRNKCPSHEKGSF